MMEEEEKSEEFSSEEEEKSEEFSALIKRLPKTELHLHLDGSLPETFIVRRASARSFDLPSPQSASARSFDLPSPQIREYLHEIKARHRRQNPGNPQTKGGNWGVFDFCNQFLQSPTEMQEAAYEICKQCASEGTVLVELRFCPTLHTLEGMSCGDAIEAVVRGIQRFEQGFEFAHPNHDLGFRGGVILCALRSHPTQHSLDIARLCAEYKNKGVVGFDLAGDEGSYPLKLHRQSIEYCQANGVRVTVHAGEWPNSADNVRLALDLEVDRIGHGGLGLVGRPDLMHRVAQNGTTVEVCLTANVRPGIKGGWVQSYETHPVVTMFDAGVRVALSSDNLLLSGDAARLASPANELEHLIKSCGFSWEDAASVLSNGPRGSFLFETEWERDDYVTKFEERTKQLLSSAGVGRQGASSLVDCAKCDIRKHCNASKITRTHTK